MISTTTILIVDDETQIRRVLRAGLSSQGYEILEAETGEEAIATVLKQHPDLVLLDVNMPGMGGIETCRRLRSSFDGPIIMVTVRNAERDKVVALDSGADDYVVKPFAMGELLARIRASLRRVPTGDPLASINTPELTVDLEKRMVVARGERVHLTPKEFEVLRLLITHQGKPLTHQRLLQTVWGPDHLEDTENLRVVINQLRKKLEKDPAIPRVILTEPWVGYRFQLPETRAGKTPSKKN